MEESLVQYHNMERRRYSRVPVNKSGWLIVEEKKQHIESIKDLSIGGASLQVCASFRPGMQCELKLVENVRQAPQVIKLSAEIIRVHNGELAVKFVDMDKESYMFLQTMLLYNVEDPLQIVTEFQDEFPQPSLIASC
jgi:c-di-GMP-binding flagellar brake protein YcgR